MLRSLNLIWLIFTVTFVAINVTSKELNDDHSNSILSNYSVHFDSEVDFRNEQLGGIIPISLINAKIDQKLLKFKKIAVAQKLDPIDLNDVVEDFKIRLLLVPIHDKLRLTKGYMQGMTSIARHGDAILHKLNIFNNHANVELTVLIKRIEVSYKYAATLAGIGPHGTVVASVNNIYATANCTVKLTDDALLSIDGMHLDRMGKIKIKMIGHRFTDFWFNSFSQIVLDVAHRAIVHEVRRVMDLLMKAINEAQ